MVDFAAGHLDSEQSHPIVAALDDVLGGGRDGVRFHAGVEYRHLCVVPGELAVADCVPPHDLTGQRAVMPTGPAAARLVELMDASKPVVREAAAQVGSIATQIWLWGQGIRPQLPEFAARYGVAGSAVVRRRSGARPRRAHRYRSRRRTRRNSGLRQRLHRAVRRRAQRLSPIATSSSSTSKQPTKPATKAR